MVDLKVLPDGIVELGSRGVIGAVAWREYKDKIVRLLTASDTPQYILTNLYDIEGVDNDIVKEFGHAPHLRHERLGYLVLLGGTAFQQFIGKLTVSNAFRTDPGVKLRVFYDREEALAFLRARREADQSRDS